MPTTLACVSLGDPTENESKINANLAKMNDWFTANKLSLNTTKSELMLITNPQHHNDRSLKQIVQIGGSKLRQVSNAKYLGLEIDDRLSWTNHIHKKVSSGIGMREECGTVCRHGYFKCSL